MADVHSRTGDVFAALASPARRELLRLLLDGPRTVNDLAGRFDMRRPSVSEHLRVLRDAGLVSERKVGRERHYRLEEEPFVVLQEWLHPYERFWRERVKALREVLGEESAAGEDGRAAGEEGHGARQGPRREEREARKEEP